MNIKYFKPYITGREIVYIKDLLDNKMTLSGDGKYTKLVHTFLEKRYGVPKALLTTSCTSALELGVKLLNLNPGDEVIAPSFTFSSTINAILVNAGLKVVFAEIDEKTLNIDPADIERKITDRTRAIIVVHYAGVACDMDKIMKLAKKHNIKVIEDAAQAIDAKYKGQYLGTIGHLGCLSFHDTKNIVSGEGGALLINRPDESMLQSAEILREKGTNRTKFLEGVVDKYTWVDIGSSYLPSDILAAFLYAQLESIDIIMRKRLAIHAFFTESLMEYTNTYSFKLQTIPSYAVHNAHIFFVTLESREARSFVMKYMRDQGVAASSHYVPLHSAPQGVKLGNNAADLPITEELSERLLRFPLYPSMTKAEQKLVVKSFIDGMELYKEKKNREKMRTVTVGISALNEGKNIHRLLTQILSQKGSNWHLDKIVVASDGSTDNTVEEVRIHDNPIITIIDGKERKGKCYRINQIFEESTSDVVVLFDGDIALKNNYVIKNLVQNLINDKECKLVGGNSRPFAPKSFFQRGVYSTFQVFDKSRQKIKNGSNVFGCTGSCLAIAKELKEKMVLPPVMNDDDYIYFSCLFNKYTFKYEKNAVVYYKLPTKVKDYLKQTFRSNPEAVDISMSKFFGSIVSEEYARPFKFYLLAVMTVLAKDPVPTAYIIILNLLAKPLYPFVSKKYNLNWFTAVSTK